MTKKQLKDYLQILQTSKYAALEVFEKDVNEFYSLAKKDKDEIAIGYGEYYDTILKYRKNIAGEESMKKLVYSLQLSITHNEPRLEADCHNMFGIIMLSVSDDMSALEHYEKAYEICRKAKLLTMRPIVANNIGDIYLRLNEYDMALEYFREAYKIINEADYGPEENYRISRYTGINFCLMNIAYTHYLQGSYEEAFRMLSCIEGVSANEDSYYAYGYAALYAVVLLKLGRRDEADEYIMTVIDDVENQREVFATGEMYIELATVLVELNHQALAKRLIQGLYNMCNVTNKVSNWCDYYKVAILYEKKWGVEQNLCKFYEKYFSYKEQEEILVKQQKINAARNKKLLDDEIKRRAAAEERNRKLKRISEHDPLTGQYNRYILNDICEKWFDDARRRRSRFAITVLDVDNFKQYNDTYGHLQGDEVLREVSDVLTECCVKEKDIIVRYGGDEFIIISRNKTDEELLRMCTDIRRALACRMINHDSSPVSQYITVTEGAVNGRVKEGETVLDYIHLADNGLYKVKNEKKNALGFYRQNDDEFVFEMLDADR